MVNIRIVKLDSPTVDRIVKHMAGLKKRNMSNVKSHKIGTDLEDSLTMKTKANVAFILDEF